MWWAESPREQRRPYLILSRQGVITHVHSLLAVPATRTIRGIATEVELDRSDGMPSACALSFDNLTLMPKAFLVERICRLPGARMPEVCTALRHATGC
jgi:mRNA interferase MazF